VVMKKPKKKKSKIKVIPKDALVVEYGVDRVVMPHRASLIKYYDFEILEMEKWCERTFTRDTWYRGNGYPGWMYFVRESDRTMFVLMWGW
jgi:hypothetical protein